MSIDSALIVRKTALPTVQQLTADIAETGVTMAFPADFSLDRNVEGWVPVSVDGEPSGFNYAVQSLAGIDPAELPEGAARPRSWPRKWRPMSPGTIRPCRPCATPRRKRC
jgi:hypothetical protein